MEHEYYTIDELAKLLRVSYRTIHRAIKAGDIRAFKVGSGEKSCIRIHKSEIFRLENQGLKTNKED
jgi:excisionase family DNA binding protein